MNSVFCSYCTARGDFGPCSCGSGAVLGCGSKPTCAACATSHRKVFAPFFKSLLKTMPASRSNSPRTKLLGILHESIVYLRSSIPQADFCLDSLRRTSSFDTDSRNFCARVSVVAQSLPLNADLAGTLEKKIAEVNVICVIERLGDFLCEESETSSILLSLVKATSTLARTPASSRRKSSVRETPSARDFYR
jgi:hypothetical protein